MNRQKFVESHLEKIIRKDKDIGESFSGADENQKAMLKESLRKSLEHSYDVYAKEYFEEKGIGSYLSTFLRIGGAVLDAYGTYLFWTFGGAGFGMKGIGMGSKFLADYIDSRHWAKYAKKGKLKDRITDDVKISGEMIAQRAWSYSPYSIGVFDLLRGRSKFDNKIISRAIDYAKTDFKDYAKRIKDTEKAEREPRIIRLDNFETPYYAEKEELAEAA